MSSDTPRTDAEYSLSEHESSKEHYTSEGRAKHSKRGWDFARQLERELADFRQQLAECEQREIALMNDVVGGAQPCCQEWETCQHRCVPRAEYFKQRLAEVQTAGGTTEPK